MHAVKKREVLEDADKVFSDELVLQRHSRSLKSLVSREPKEHLVRIPHTFNLLNPNANIIDMIGNSSSHTEGIAQLENMQQRQNEAEEICKIATLFQDIYGEIPDVAYSSLEIGVLQGSNDLIENILCSSPPAQKHVDAVVDLFPKFLEGHSHFLHDDEQILEAFSKFVCTAGASMCYEESYRHRWLSNLAKLVTQRLVEDISLPPLFWVYYGRSQLLMARDYFSEERAKILQDAIDFLSRNNSDPDIQTMIGILKAEIYINCNASGRIDQKEWFEIGRYFMQQGSCLDSQFHYALCLARRTFAQPNDTEGYRDVLYLLGPRILSRSFENIETKAKTDLWWSECRNTITDVCVRVTLSLKSLKRNQFLDQLDNHLRQLVVNTVKQIEDASVDD